MRRRSSGCRAVLPERLLLLSKQWRHREENILRGAAFRAGRWQAMRRMKSFEGDRDMAVCKYLVCILLTFYDMFSCIQNSILPFYMPWNMFASDKFIQLGI